MSLIVLILSLAGLLLGLLLMLWGYRGPRVGQEPYCRRCRYNLTGVESSGRCPECGSAFTAETVHRGRRRRRWGWAAAGGVPFVVGLGLLCMAWIVRWRSIDVYDYYPTSWLISLAERNEADAIPALLRRVKTGVLNEADAARLAQVSLQRQASSSTGVYPLWSVECLPALESRGLLSQADRQRYLQQSLVLQLAVRRWVRFRDPMVTALRCQDRGAFLLPFRFAVRVDHREVDGRPYPVADDGVHLLLEHGRQPAVLGNFAPDGFPAESIPPPDRPGIHIVTWTCTVFVFPQDADVEPQAALWSYPVVLENRVDALPQDAADPVKLVPDSLIERLLRDELGTDDFGLIDVGGGECELIYLRKARLPHERWSSTVALRILARDASGERPAGEMVITSAGTKIGPMPRIPLPPDGHVTLVFSPNPDAVRTTVDRYEVWSWEGPLEIGPIRVLSADQRPPLGSAATQIKGRPDVAEQP